ncbi:MAG TPA: hypothetical protein VFA34_11240 [Actinomycetota bacterium]|jgi:vacuolar-type H+-ATPase subunit H|nr:hypothetical protein [Actinomycetota bacterium]
MSAIERGLYVAVGAADLAVEKVQQIPVVKQIVERTSELRQKSIIDQAREIEPRLRKQAKELATRGEKVVERVRKDAKDFQQQVREFPTEARKQIREFPDTARKQVETFRTDARKQVTDIRGRIQKAVGRGNGSKPAPKTKVSAAAKSAAAEIS